MIRVLQMIGSLEAGGSQALIMELYRHIDRSKLQFDFVVDHPENQHYAAEIRALGGIIYELPCFTGRNVHMIRDAWRTFLTLHPEYTVLHSHIRSYASLYLPIAKQCGVTTIIHSHSTSNGKGFSGVVKAILQYPIRFQADYFLACSQQAGQWLFGKRVTRKPEYHVLSNGIDTQKFGFDSVTRAECRQQLNLDGKYVVGHVGRMVPAKNHIFLLKIFVELLKQRKDVVLLLLGDGSDREKVERQIVDSGLQNHVILLGQRENLYRYYHAMDVFVFPSLWEGLGISLIEAQVTGLPCIVSDRVPVEADLHCGLIRWLSLQDGAETWAENILSLPNQNRKSYSEQAENSGYDIRSIAQEMGTFYEKISKDSDSKTEQQ